MCEPWLPPVHFFGGETNPLVRAVSGGIAGGGQGIQEAHRCAVHPTRRPLPALPGS